MSGPRRDSRQLYPNSPMSQIADPKRVKPIIMDGGLDYVSPRSMLAPGALLDCLNYEIVERNGVKRADGYLRWDGGADIDIEEIFYLRSNSASTVMTAASTRGLYLYSTTIETNEGKAYPFGVCVGARSVSSTENYIFYVRIDARKEPGQGDTVRQLGVASGSFNFVSTEGVPAKASDISVFDSGYTANFSSEASYSARNLTGYWYDFLSNYYRETINGPRSFLVGGVDSNTDLPTAPLNIVGLHFFNDRAYAIADLHSLYLTTNGTEVFAGDVLYNVDEGLSQVLETRLISGNWTSGTAQILYKDINQLDFGKGSINTSTDRSAFASGYAVSGGDVITCLRTGASCGTTESSATYIRRYQPQLGGLYRSFSEKQAWDAGRVDSVTIVAGTMAGFDSPPTVSFSGGGGYGASAFARVSGGVVTHIVMLDPGQGYTSAPTVTVTPASGDAGAAVGTATFTANLATWRHAGMRFIDTGWQVNFNNGDSPIGTLVTIDRRKAPTSQTSDAALATSTTSTTGTDGRPQWAGFPSFTGSIENVVGNWFPSTGNLLDPSLLSSENDTDYIYTPMRSQNANLTHQSSTITVGNFKNSLSGVTTGGIIRGITVTLSYDVPAGGTYVAGAADLLQFNVRACLVRLTEHPELPGQIRAAKISDYKEVALSTPTGALDTSATLGGVTDLWGLTKQTIDDLLLGGGDLGVSFDVKITRATTSVNYEFNLGIDQVKLELTYQSPSVTYYFTDSATSGARNVIAADLVSYSLESGNFINGDAKGVLQLANLRYIELLHGTQRHSIGAQGTWKVYQAYPGSGSAMGTSIADVTAAMTYNGLDSRQDLVDNDSRYEIISANFYEGEEYEGVYGCSGAGRAFYFDGTWFSRIYAVPLSEPDSATKDKPRHLVNYKFHLALGYKSGTVLISRQGRPEDFNFVLGATTFGFGDRITGMAPLPGEYLGIFCENSIWGLAGQTVASFAARNITPASGAIEYTIVSLGENPIFCNSRGIYTLAQIQEYGDFAGVPLSHVVTPKLIPRLRRNSSPNSATTAVGLVAAYPVRAKNQYRLWFQDGLQLVMTLVGPEKQPQFTWLQYLLNRAGESVYSSQISPAPLAICSQKDSFGRERILWSPDVIGPGVSSLAYTLSRYPGQIYEIDKLWGFDSSTRVHPMPAHFTTNYFYEDSPVNDFTVSSVLVEGSSRQVGDLTVKTSKNFEEASTDFSSGQKLVLANTGLTGLPIDYSAYADRAPCNEEGRNILLKFENYNTDNQNASETTYNITKVPQPPHYVQLLLVDYEESKRDA